MLWKTTTFLAICSCAPFPDTAPGEVNPPVTLGEILDQAAELVTGSVLRAELATATAEPIYEVTVFPDGPVSTFTFWPPPQVSVHLLPRRDDVLRSDVLTIWLTTGGPEGVPERDAWLVFSADLLEEPVNWGSAQEPVLQMIPFDVVLPFPGLRITDYGSRFHRQPHSGIVQIHGSVRLPAPLYLQMVIEAPEENELGYIVTHAYGLIPGGL